MKRFTNVDDLINGPGLQQALEDARNVVRHPWNHEALGKHKTLGLLFMNPSLRTRMSTEKAASLLGMDTIILNAGSDSWTLETRDGVVMDGGAHQGSCSRDGTLLRCTRHSHVCRVDRS